MCDDRCVQPLMSVIAHRLGVHVPGADFAADFTATCDMFPDLNPELVLDELVNSRGDVSAAYAKLLRGASSVGFVFGEGTEAFTPTATPVCERTPSVCELVVSFLPLVSCGC